MFYEQPIRGSVHFTICTSVNTTWHTACLIQDFMECAGTTPTFSTWYQYYADSEYNNTICNRQAALHSALFNFWNLSHETVHLRTNLKFKKSLRFRLKVFCTSECLYLHLPTEETPSDMSYLYVDTVECTEYSCISAVTHKQRQYPPRPEPLL